MAELEENGHMGRSPEMVEWVGVMQGQDSECQGLVTELGKDPQVLYEWHRPAGTLALAFWPLGTMG